MLSVIEEGLGIVLGLETDQIVAEQRFHQLAMTWQGRQHTARRPRDMQEEADAVFHPAPTQFAAKRDQVIILHPDDVVRPDQRQQGFGEADIDPLITLVETAFVIDQVSAIVKQRPQSTIGVAVVIFLLVLRFEIKQGHRDATDHLHRDMAGIFLDSVAAPAEPQALVLTQGSGQGHGQAASGAYAGIGGRIDAIRYDDKTAQ